MCREVRMGFFSLQLLMFSPSTNHWKVVPLANLYPLTNTHGFVLGNGNFAIAGGQYEIGDMSENIFT